MRNFEFKVRLADEKEAVRRARALGAEIWGDLRQTDTYFNVPTGRLKLRETAGFDAEIIFYQRDEKAEMRPSDYTRAAVRQAAELRDALSSALSVLAVVRKRRTLLLAGTVRIHLDNVETLGRFLEIEVPVSESIGPPGTPTPDLETSASQKFAVLISGLGYTLADGIRRSYLDLVLEQTASPARERRQ